MTETTMTIMMSVNQVKDFPPKAKKQILQKKIDRMTGLCLNWPDVGVPPGTGLAQAKPRR
jgi:hypothetical protein